MRGVCERSPKGVKATSAMVRGIVSRAGLETGGLRIYYRGAIWMAACATELNVIALRSHRRESGVVECPNWWTSTRGHFSEVPIRTGLIVYFSVRWGAGTSGCATT